MDLPEARLIARHHLGDRLHWVGRGGPHADLWIVQAWPDTGHMMSAQAATVDAAAADCAAQLRAAGWAPTHERLEWIHGCLYLHVGSTKFIVATTIGYPGGWAALIQPGCHDWYRCTEQADAVAHVVEWCAANLPYHLPPFPGASDA